MADPKDKLVSDTPPNAAELLRKFLTDNNLELKLSTPLVRAVDGGGVIVEQPQVIVDYKVVNSIKN